MLVANANCTSRTRKVLKDGSAAGSPDTSIGPIVAQAASKQATNVTASAFWSDMQTIPSMDGRRFSISTSGSALSTGHGSRARYCVHQRPTRKRLGQVGEGADVARRASMHRIV